MKTSLVGLIFFIQSFILKSSDFQINVRNFEPANYKKINDSELDSQSKFKLLSINSKETCLIVIDAWGEHENEGFQYRVNQNIKNKLNPLIKKLRDVAVPIIHANHGRNKASTLDYLDSDIDLDAINIKTSEEFDGFLKEKGIKNLLYCGYALNWCVINRPIGIINMSKKGYNIILVRDATLAFETPETLSGEWAKISTINIVEHQFGGSTSSDEITAE